MSVEKLKEYHTPSKSMKLKNKSKIEKCTKRTLLIELIMDSSAEAHH